MPYRGQIASGEGLIALEQSKLFEEFVGQISISKNEKSISIDPAHIPESSEHITKVLAIDGSIVSEKIKNGFPSAEASLVQIALVSIDLEKLDIHSHKTIIPPSAFNEMDKAAALQCILPGCNVAKDDGTPPRDFFRQSIYEALQGSVQKNHETLLETYRSLVSNRVSEFKCPHPDCEVSMTPLTNSWKCSCLRSTTLYETDPLRFHERFNDIGPNGEPHGEVMRFLELIILLNVLRYFASFPQGIKILPKIAFVVDGPLAVFGQFAAVVPYVRQELQRINELCVEKTGKHLVLFSLIKTGLFFEHFEQLDFDEVAGPNGKYEPQTTLLPDISYIHQAIVYRSLNAKPWGEDTYFGRIVLYKSKSGQRMVINTPKVTPTSLDLRNTSLTSYPSLPEVIGIVDRLSTYLFEGGFVPIVRAHSHAAIPLKMGGEIIKSLFR